MRLSNRVAIVTGASAGIGRAIAKRFAEEGANLSLSSVDRIETMEEDAESFRAMGRKVHVMEVDVGQLDDLKRMVEETVCELDRVDILVNNAGIRLEKPIGEVTEEEWDRLMAVDLKACFFASQYVLPHMPRDGRGRIIHIASERGHIGTPGVSVYCAAKGAILNLTRQMAVELAPVKIGVTAISPGPILTEYSLDRYQDDPEGRKAMLNAVPMGRFGTPEEVAAAAAFLASDEANFIHGTSLVVDGGYLAQ